MVDAAGLLVYVLVFVTGFITGKLFAALQFAGMKSAAKMANADPEARKSVNRLIQLVRKL